MQAMTKTAAIRSEIASRPFPLALRARQAGMQAREESIRATLATMRPENYRTRTVTVDGQPVTLYSRDGERWSSSIEDLERAHERLSAASRGVYVGAEVKNTSVAY